MSSGSRLNSLLSAGSPLVDQQLAQTLRRLESRHMSLQESLRESLQRGSARREAAASRVDRSPPGADGETAGGNGTTRNLPRPRSGVTRYRPSILGWGRAYGSGGGHQDGAGIGGGSTTGPSIGALFDDDDFIFGVEPFRPFDNFTESIAANPANYLVRD
jgi:hypothetical protein